MAETLLQKAQRLGIQPAGAPMTPSVTSSVYPSETLLQKAQRLGIKPANPPEHGYFGRLGTDFTKRAQTVQEGKKASATGEQTGAETFGQTLGQGIGMVTDIATELPGVKQALGLAGTGIQKLSETAPIKAIGGALAPVAQAGLTAYEGASPRTKRNIEAGINIASVLPIAKAAKVSAEAITPVIKTTEKIVTPILETAKTKTTAYRIGIRDKMIDKEVGNLITKNRGIEKQVKLAEQKNIPVRETISDPKIYSGLKVEKGTINPDIAIEELDNRIGSVLDAKKEMLPILDKYVPTTPKETIRARAIKEVQGQTLPADEQDIISAINKQVDALPDNLSVSDIDKLRAQARKASRDAKGLQKRNSEYTALENVTRDTIFDITDNLPFDTNGEFAALNTYAKNMIGTKEFLDKTIRGQKVKGGRLGTYTGRIIGASAGAMHGVFGAIAGSEIGGNIANILMNNQLGSNFKLKIIKGMTDDPSILKEVDAFLQKVKDYKPPMLEAPAEGAPRTWKTGGKPIQLPAISGTTKEAREIKNIQEQISQRSKTLSSQAENATPITTNTIKPISQTIPKSTPKVKVTLPKAKTPLETEAKKYKSAEEFVKSRTKLLHGTNEGFDVFDPAKMGTNEKNFAAKSSFFFTDSAETAKSYGKNLKEVYAKFDNPVVIDAEGKMFGDMRDIIDKTVSATKKNGNDGVIIKNLSDRKDWGNYEPATHYAIFDVNKLKTKSQLTDIWNKANKVKVSLPKSNIVSKKSMGSYIVKTPNGKYEVFNSKNVSQGVYSKNEAQNILDIMETQ